MTRWGFISHPVDMGQFFLVFTGQSHPEVSLMQVVDKHTFVTVRQLSKTAREMEKMLETPNALGCI